MIVRDDEPADRAGCLDVFDGDMPEFFSESERVDFNAFLDRFPERYAVVEDEDGRIVGCGGRRDMAWTLNG